VYIINSAALSFAQRICNS